MRKTIIAGNWKMYKTIAESIELVNGLKRELFAIDSQLVDIVICPPFSALSEVVELLIDSDIKMGAQDMFWQEEGAFTGEVSPSMLKDVGCQFVIIGHSERRQYFNETNESVNKKIKAALMYGLSPIMCVGETLNERDAGKTFVVLKDHVHNGLVGIDAESAQKIIIAYEPVWAIGTGKTATPAQAQEAQKFIRELLKKLYNTSVAENIRIQYGGSVKPENAAELMAQPDIDGALVGGASLKSDTFSAIIKNASGVKK
ncbi:MAG: triose-phosphate isomerase [Candidatus Omnitrophota bacterium]|jgi:triosephosphate isomerase|nr:MAG: triose-phosphate isomerase [Candidatus Omnitrophota bacterium]